MMTECRASLPNIEQREKQTEKRREEAETTQKNDLVGKISNCLVFRLEYYEFRELFPE